MKKTISVILTVILIALNFITPVMAKSLVELELTDATVYAGDEFEVKVFISDNSKLSGAVIDMQYDTEKLEFISAEQGAIIDENAMVSIKNNTVNKIIKFTYMAPDSSITSEGILFTVKFKALPNAEGKSEIKISIPNAGDFVNADLDKLDYTVKNSTIKIINTTYESTEPINESSSTETDLTISETTDITEAPTGENHKENDTDNENLKLVIGLFTAGGIIILGVIIYLVVSKRKKEVK